MTSTINETEVYRMLDQITELKAKLARQEQLLNSVAKSYDEKLTQAYMSGGIKESTRRIIKEWQLFAGEKATENGLIAEQLEFTVRIAQDWKTRAEAAERRVAELEAQLAATAWRPVVADRFNIPHDRPEFGENVELLITGFLNRAGQWVYNDDLPGFRTPVIGWRPIDPPAHPTPSNSTGLAIGE